MTDERQGAYILGSFVDALQWDACLAHIEAWTKKRESRVVCICNVHSVVTARHNEHFRRILNSADMATPDGMPLAWLLRLQGFRGQQRINGPDLMWQYCKLAALSGQKLFFLGSTEETLMRLTLRMQGAFPALCIAGTYAPPFRRLTAVEDQEIVDRISHSGATVVFVGLGCPKQEIWMAEHRGLIQGAMLGVGAAFEYHAGVIARAPQWIQNVGLEWLCRLVLEPRRLGRRYVVTNTLFIWHVLKDMVSGRMKACIRPKQKDNTLSRRYID